jgi:DNA-binding NarL/FixJ family response regulator
MTERIRVLIADDQAITRTGLQHLLAEDTGIVVVGAARTGAETVALAEALQPDVILMDLRMPDGNGIEATRRIYRASPRVGILVLTVFEDDASVFPAIRAGARGYLLKQTEQDELLRAIRTVAQGGAIFSPGIAQRVLGYLSAPPPVVVGAVFDALTAREREILEGIAQGQTNSEIAAQLNVSPKTIGNAISNILLKVHATDRAKLMLMAQDAGMGQHEPGS